MDRRSKEKKGPQLNPRIICASYLWAVSPISSHQSVWIVNNNVANGAGGWTRILPCQIRVPHYIYYGPTPPVDGPGPPHFAAGLHFKVDGPLYPGFSRPSTSPTAPRSCTGQTPPPVFAVFLIRTLQSLPLLCCDRAMCTRYVQQRNCPAMVGCLPCHAKDDTFVPNATAHEWLSFPRICQFRFRVANYCGTGPQESETGRSS